MRRPKVGWYIPITLEGDVKPEFVFQPLNTPERVPSDRFIDMFDMYRPVDGNLHVEGFVPRTSGTRQDCRDGSLIPGCQQSRYHTAVHLHLLV